MDNIELGDKVRCKWTGFTGIATARTEFLNGCIQYLVAPKWDKKSSTVEEVGIDSQSLEVVTPKKRKVEKQSNGGPMRKAMRRRNY